MSNFISNKRKSFDLYMALSIFIVSAFELLSFAFQDSNNQPEFTSLGDNYVVYWYPLFCTIEFFVFSTFFLVKCLRYKSCIYTKTISVLYFLLQSINLISILVTVDYVTYLQLCSPLILVLIVLTCLIKFIRWFLK